VGAIKLNEANFSILYLSDGSCQKTNDAFVRYGNDTLTVNFNNPVTDTNSASFSDPSSQKATNLPEKKVETRRLVKLRKCQKESSGLIK
jgi:hypothetical protein